MEAIRYIVDTLLWLLTLAFVLRLLFQLVRADFRDPMPDAIVRVRADAESLVVEVLDEGSGARRHPDRVTLWDIAGAAALIDADRGSHYGRRRRQERQAPDQGRRSRAREDYGHPDVDRPDHCGARAQRGFRARQQRRRGSVRR